MRTVIAIFLALVALSVNAATISIPAGGDIQSYINANPGSTTFLVQAGERRLTSALTPKAGNTFIGEPGTILNGSKLLTSFTASSGRWYASGQTQQGSTNGGDCLSGYGRCANPEDVYFDNKPLQHVESLSAVGPGKFYFDYSADRIYLGDNPAGHKVEASVTAKAFNGNSSTGSVTLKNFTIEKFASPSSNGAIDSGDGSGWLVDNMVVQLNHAVGVTLYNGTIQNSRLNWNGQSGAQDTASGKDGGTATVINNEIAFNNFAKYNYDWEAGGIKFCVIDGLVVRGNSVHDNYGNGVWDDIDARNIIIENNTVFNNLKTGIVHEIGFNAVIRNNLVYGNTSTSDNGGQIVVYASTDTEVYGNHVTAPSGSNAIIVAAEDREGGHRATNVSVHHNFTTVPLGNDNGMSGLANMDGWKASDNIKFDYNTYYAKDMSAVHWQYPSNQTWSQFRAAGQEAHGVLLANAPTPEPKSYAEIVIAGLILLAHRPRRVA